MAIRDIYHNNSKFTLSYEIVEGEGKETILFLHGWGSNKEIMKRSFKQPFMDFRQIYVDLPGFGKSSIPTIALSTQDYAQILTSFLAEIKESPDTMLGHSFGGKVGILLQPQYVILLSSAGIISKKSFKTKVKIYCAKILKNIPFCSKIGVLLRSKDALGMNEVMYSTFKNVVVEDFSSYFSSFLGYALVFWGREDNITPISSGQLIAELIPRSDWHLLDGDHFFFMQHDNAQKIAQHFIEVIQK